MHRSVICVFLCFILISLAPWVSAANMEEDPDLTTVIVDQAADLPDGVYTPDSFAFSGGSGRVKITCPEVRVEDGLAYAVIQYSSSSYAYLKASGKIIYPEIIDGKSVFTIPIALNRNNQIFGLTTKMSSPHEIEYILFVGLSNAGNVQDWLDMLDSEAPEIPGFVFQDEIPAAENLKLYRYDRDALLFEIDTGMDGTAAENAEEELSAADSLAAMYRARVLKYFAVPEDAEIPAGLEKHVILIQKPVSGICAASAYAADIPELCAAMNQELDGIPYAGSYDAPDYKALLLNKTKLLLADEAILPALRSSMGDRLAALGIAAIVDCRTADTQDAWQMLYSLLFNSEE